MYLVHTVIDCQCYLFQSLTSSTAAHISFADIPGTGKDILLEIVILFDNIILFTIFICHTVTQTDARRPDQPGSHQLGNPVDQDTRYAQKRYVFLRHIQSDSHILKRFILNPLQKMSHGRCFNTFLFKP